MKKQSNTHLGTEMRSNQYHKGISLHLTATTKRANQKPTTVDKKFY